MLPRVLLIMAALLGGCVVDDQPSPRRGPAAPRAAVDQHKLRGEVLQELDRYYKNFSARNWDAVASHFWPGATITTISSGGTRSVIAGSVDEFIESARAEPGGPQLIDERMTNAQVRVEGSLALVWATYQARFGERGNYDESSGTDAFTLIKLDGRWKITSLAFAAE